MNLNLHIEHLVLDGLAIEGSQTANVQAAVEAELRRLITENGLASHLQSGGAMSRVNVSSIQFTQGSNPVYLGRQIAQSIFTGIGNQK